MEVYAAGSSAELFLNGRSLGRKKINPNKRCVRFKGKYVPGELTAVSYDGFGKELARTSLKSAGKHKRLTIVPEQREVARDGFCYGRVSYTEENGPVKVTKRGDVSRKSMGENLWASAAPAPITSAVFLQMFRIHTPAKLSP